LKDKFDSGELGVKTGRGFYDWQVRDSAELIEKRNQFLLDLLKMERSSKS
jgi:3-hydroxybutyryl-CoA dehydrogenase